MSRLLLRKTLSLLVVSGAALSCADDRAGLVDSGATDSGGQKDVPEGDLIGPSARADAPESESLGRVLSFSVLRCSRECEGDLTVQERRLGVLDNADAFKSDFLATVPPGTHVPSVDFSTSVVVVAHMGRQPDCSYRVAFLSAREEATHVMVDLALSTANTSLCDVSASLSYPYCFVSVEKAPGRTYLFREQRTIRGCRE